MLAMLSIAIGLVFVMLLFSFLASSVMELIAALFSLRGKHLLGALKDMLGSITPQFTQHVYYQQLLGGTRQDKRKGYPSYIAPGTFSSIVSDILHDSDPNKIKERIEAMPEGQLRDLMLFLYNQSNGHIASFKEKTEEWFNEVMDRASGAYKRKTKNWLITVGFVIAVLFNVDPLDIYHNLSMNATLREFIADTATEYVQTNPSPEEQEAAKSYWEAKEQIGVLVNENIQSISEPLGIGWNTVNMAEMTFQAWLIKVFGWLVTALCISMGATFWFDILKSLISIRSSGPPPPSGEKEAGLSNTFTESTPRVVSPPPADSTVRGEVLPPIEPDADTPG